MPPRARCFRRKRTARSSSSSSRGHMRATFSPPFRRHVRGFRARMQSRCCAKISPAKSSAQGIRAHSWRARAAARCTSAATFPPSAARRSTSARRRTANSSASAAAKSTFWTPRAGRFPKPFPAFRPKAAHRRRGAAAIWSVKSPRSRAPSPTPSRG